MCPGRGEGAPCRDQSGGKDRDDDVFEFHWSPIMPLTAAEVKPAVKEVRCPACFRYMGAFVGKAQCPSCKRWVKVDRPIDSG